MRQTFCRSIDHNKANRGFGANICPLGNSDEQRKLHMLMFADGGKWETYRF